jgi:hypothetical protein
LVTVESWFLTVLSYVITTSPAKKAISTGVSLAANLFLYFIGRKSMGNGWPVQPGQSIAITAWQTVLVTPWIIAVGLLFGLLYHADL